MKPETMNAYVAILEEELVLATGCTEPIAIAYAAAKLRDTLGGAPERIRAEVSGNILKNVKSVVVPGTGGMKGIAAAIAAGVIAGDAEAELQVIGKVTKSDLEAIRAYADRTPVSCASRTTTRTSSMWRKTARSSSISRLWRRRRITCRTRAC